MLNPGITMWYIMACDVTKMQVNLYRCEVFFALRSALWSLSQVYL